MPKIKTKPFQTPVLSKEEAGIKLGELGTAIQTLAYRIEVNKDPDKLNELVCDVDDASDVLSKLRWQLDKILWVERGDEDALREREKGRAPKRRTG